MIQALLWRLISIREAGLPDDAAVPDLSVTSSWAGYVFDKVKSITWQ